ncbi:MAG: hypothetical protein ABI647_02785 [Gemmatimonadota bacterium]
MRSCSREVIAESFADEPEPDGRRYPGSCRSSLSSPVADVVRFEDGRLGAIEQRLSELFS